MVVSLFGDEQHRPSQEGSQPGLIIVLANGGEGFGYHREISILFYFIYFIFLLGGSHQPSVCSLPCPALFLVR